MKNLNVWLVLFVILFFAVFTTLGDAKTVVKTAEPTTFENGDWGIFEYPWQQTLDINENPEFVVRELRYPNKTLQGEGFCFGIITPQTKVKVLNRDVKPEDLDLVSGNEVVAFGKFRREGQGEGSKTFCEELNIWVVRSVTQIIKKDVKVFEVGDWGTLECPWQKSNDAFTVWEKRGPDAKPFKKNDYNDYSEGHYGFCFGTITPKTKINIINPELATRILQNIDGKEIVAYGRFRQEGQGEGSKTFCEELNIYLLNYK